MTICVNYFNIYVFARGEVIKPIKEKLARIFDIVIMNFFTFYISLQATYNLTKKSIKLFLLSYIVKLFDQYGMLKAKIIKMSIRKRLLLLYNKPVFLNKMRK